MEDSTRANLGGLLRSATQRPSAITVIAMATLPETADQDVDPGLVPTNATEGGIQGQDPPLHGVIGGVTTEMIGEDRQDAIEIGGAAMTAETASIVTVEGTHAPDHQTGGETCADETVQTSGERTRRGLEAEVLRRTEGGSTTQEEILQKALVITVSNKAN